MIKDFFEIVYHNLADYKYEAKFGKQRFKNFIFYFLSLFCLGFLGIVLIGLFFYFFRITVPVVLILLFGRFVMFLINGFLNEWD